jgi:hemerythrin-like metal-binding protein
MWTDNLKVGVRDFDDDHKRVVRIINELNNAIQDAAVTGEIEPIEMEIALHRLDNYILYHCAQEELSMTLTRYPDLEEHKKEHVKLRVLIGDLQDRFKGSTNPKDAMDISTFIFERIIDHILVTDRKYTAHLNAKGII